MYGMYLCSFLISCFLLYLQFQCTPDYAMQSVTVLPVVKVDDTVIHRGLQGVFVSLFRAIALQFSMEDDHVTLVS